MDRERLRRAVDRVLRPPDESIRRLGTRTKPNSAKSETTIVVFRYAAGLICAADTQVSMGSSIVSQSFNKIMKLGSNSFLVASGSVACIQMLCDQLRRRCEEFEDLHEVPISVHGQARYLSELCRATGEVTLFDGIVAGVNRDGRHYMLRVSADGSVLAYDPFATCGSGGDAAMVALDLLWMPLWNQGLTLNKAVTLAIQAIAVASSYDSGSADPRVAMPMMAAISMAGTMIPEDVVARAYQAIQRENHAQSAKASRELRNERSQEESES